MEDMPNLFPEENRDAGKDSSHTWLTVFCSKDIDRYNIQNPWSLGEYTYATNGHIMVRVPRIPNVLENANAPNLDAFSFDMPEARKFIAKDLPENVKQTVECESCGGLGTEHDCPDCNCECEECEGRGEIHEETDNDYSVSLCDTILALKYVRMLSALPNVYVPKNPDMHAPMPFRFDGGCGLLMPMRAKNKNHLDIVL